MDRKHISAAPTLGSQTPWRTWLLAGCALLLLPISAFAGPLDGSCIVGQRPAATLLFPYFEVDLDNPSGPTTLISINNAAAEPALAHIVVWSDCHLLIFSFDLFLDGNDVAAINLRDIPANGSLPATSPGVGGLAAFPGCSDPISNPKLDANSIAEIQAQLTGKPAPSDGFCYGSNRDETRVAVGFLTVDAMNNCSGTIRFPTTMATSSLVVAAWPATTMCCGATPTWSTRRKTLPRASRQ